MPRLLHDRYVAYDDIHGCDLATGDEVRLDALPGVTSEQDIPALIEVLNDAQDGRPRWVVADVRNGLQAAAMGRRAAGLARARGFVPLLVPLYDRLRDGLADDLTDRTLLLIGSFAKGVTSARAALVDAAARSPRPHVLLTFRIAEGEPAACVVREARAAYGAPALTKPAGTPVVNPDVERHVERASRAAEFQRSGRHAAAERLLREVAGALTRRSANVPAAQVLVTLGRLLLERGRAASADDVFGDAAGRAQAGGDEGLSFDARLWQATARTDAGRLTDAESIARAVLLTKALSPARERWADAVLARVLCWQGRVEDAPRGDFTNSDSVVLENDAVVAASIEATAVRVLVAAGDLFRAGLRARALVSSIDRVVEPPPNPVPDALPRIIALTAHLRVLVAAGDLHLAYQTLGEIRRQAREARAPFRDVRARLIWHDALRRAGRTRDADRELGRLSRVRRVAPPLLRRAIEKRMAGGGETSPPPAAGGAASRDAGIAAALVHLVQEEESDGQAVQRLLDRVGRDLQPCRVDLVSADAGPATVLMTSGTGLATRLGERVIEAGVAIPADGDQGGREIGVPVRLGGRLLGALVCRWPLDRQPPPHAMEVAALAAAVAAPRVDALVTARRDTARASTSIPELVGASAAMADVRKAIERAARAPFAVLIEGESGVGKELAARAIHQLSARRERRFCDVNCAAMPDDLLESELFGHAKGAFTGAVADTRGLFEEADGGTLFLDEVPDLSPRAQAKLLRVLQQQEVRRVGETFTRAVDVRLVAAANRDMRAEADAARFRADLLFRLDVIHIRIPPLRERPEDISMLARHFWQLSAARVGSRATLTHGVLTGLARYPWPGNARELQNVMAALAVAAPAHGRVAASALPMTLTGAAPLTAGTLAEARTQFERRFVETALARAGGSRTKAAAELGLSRQGLLKLMVRLRLGQ